MRTNQWKAGIIMYLFVGILLALTACAPVEQYQPLFSLVPPSASGVNFGNFVIEDDSLNILDYLYFYNGGGVGIGDMNNDDLPDIYFSANQTHNKLFINVGTNDDGIPQFKDITTEAGLPTDKNWSTGISLVDINGDGWLDIYSCEVGGYLSFKGVNRLFINQGCLGDPSSPCVPQFVESAKPYGLNLSGFSTQAAFFDYDLDSDLDMYLLRHSVHSTESYRDTSITRQFDPLSGDRLFRNNADLGQLEFTDVTEEANIYSGVAGYGLDIAIGDIDKNGYPDIYISNDFHENDFLYLNRGNGTFEETGTTSLGHTSYFSMGNDLADLNNDTWLDIISLDMKPEDEVIFKSSQGPDSYDIYHFKREFGYHHQFPQNAVQLSQGAFMEGTRFSESACLTGLEQTDWSWGTLIADFDLDSHMDIHITNGIPRRPNDLDYLKYISNTKIQEKATDMELLQQMPDGKVSNYIFRGKEEKFEDITKQWGLARASNSNGSAYADLDQDGDLDLVINNLNDSAYLYLNQATTLSQGHYLKIKLNSSGLNTKGVGTKVTVFSGQKMFFREFHPSRGYLSSVDYELHFGLGATSAIDSIIIVTPQNKEIRLFDVHPDQLLKINLDQAQKTFPAKGYDTRRKKFAGKNEKVFDTVFVHKENPFNDINREPLMPYLLSTEGPKLAVGDINGDGLEDIYVGGATGQAGTFYIQTEVGSMNKKQSAGITADQNREDTGVEFLDVDGDGDLDLYIGSGGNQFYQEDSLLTDRLLINDGIGNFTRDTKALPPIFEQTSCVKSFDFDLDGDMDIFVGTRSKAFFYGQDANQHLLVNDGSGNFQIANEDLIDLKKLGMVTDATWSDIDGDGLHDLVIVGDWMPLSIYKNNGQRFVRLEDQNFPAGWYNTIVSGDIDNDGDVDFALGNFGLNSDLNPSIKKPVNLYISDFDKNLTPDPIVTYFKNNAEFPLMGLDALAGQLVYLKKKYRSYSTFAVQEIHQIFEPSQLQKAEKKSVQNLATGLALNDGKGRFSIKILPLQVQNSSTQAIVLFDIDHDGHLDLLLAGNNHNLQPAIGRMDASYGHFLLGEGGGNFQHLSNQEVDLLIEGQVRDMEIINIKGSRHLIVARNNESLQIIKINSNVDL